MRPLILLFIILCGCSSLEETDNPDGSDGGPQPGEEPPDHELPDYEAVFKTDRVVDLSINFHDQGWETILASPEEDIYVPADIVYDGEELQNVGIRLKGNSSRWSVTREQGIRYSLKLDTDRYVDDQKLHGLDKLNFNNGFNDPTQLREVLSTDLYQRAGLPSPQIGYLRMTINGDLMGMYSVVEQVDKDFLRRHFEDDEGDLYKPEPPAGVLTYMGSEIEAYRGLEIKTNEDSSDHSAILDFLDVLNNSSANELETALPEVFDVDLFLRYLAISALHLNLDSLLSIGHNYYLYEDRSTGRFVLIPWDLNGTFGQFNCQMRAGEVANFSYDSPWCLQGPGGQPSSPSVIELILAVPTFRIQYESYLDEFAQTTFTQTDMNERIQTWAGVVRPSVQEDPNRFFSVNAFERGLTDDHQTINLSNGSEQYVIGLSSLVTRRLEQLEIQGL